MAPRCSERTNDYMACLEAEVQQLRNEVRVLRISNVQRGPRKSKEQLRKDYALTKDNVLFSGHAMTFASEYLLPRFKFLNKGWERHDPTKKKGFSMFVKRHLPIRKEKVYSEEWDRIIAGNCKEIYLYEV